MPVVSQRDIYKRRVRRMPLREIDVLNEATHQMKIRTFWFCSGGWVQIAIDTLVVCGCILRRRPFS
jgi:uncharacterized membrane protein